MAMQQHEYGIASWYLFHDPFTFAAFFTYFTCAMASCKRAPFDLAEAESELVAGFHTEYSGFRWLVIFMAEYGSMFAVSGIASVMFLGGWSLGLPFELSELLTGYLGSVSFTPPLAANAIAIEHLALKSDVFTGNTCIDNFCVH